VAGDEASELPSSETCLERAESVALGELGQASSPKDRWRDAALRDLAAIILAGNTELLASAYPIVSDDGVVKGVGVVPSGKGLEAAALFETARGSLIRDYQGLVSADDIVVQEAVDYTFDDLCGTYLKLDGLMVREGKQLLDELSLDTTKAKITFSALAPVNAEIVGAIKGAEPFTTVTLVDSFPKIEFAHRSNDTNGFNAGDSILIDLVGSDSTAICTSGFVLRNNANTARYMLTAGHCNNGKNDNAKVYNGTGGGCSSALSGMGTVGLIGSNLLYPPTKTDTAIIYPAAGALHTPKMWAGSSCVGGGEADLVGIQPPYGGLVVGYSGAQTGQSDATVSVTAPVCISMQADQIYQVCQVWKTNSWSQPVQRGDSGGPVFGYNGSSSVWGVGTINAFTQDTNGSWASYFTALTTSSYQYSSPLALP
jgi:hypothetical protein